MLIEDEKVMGKARCNSGLVMFYWRPSALKVMPSKSQVLNPALDTLILSREFFPILPLSTSSAAPQLFHYGPLQYDERSHLQSLLQITGLGVAFSRLADSCGLL